MKKLLFTLFTVFTSKKENVEEQKTEPQEDRYSPSPQCFWDRLNLNMQISRWERITDENGQLCWRDKNNPNDVVYERPELTTK
jgi:hypothetical protein